LGAGLVVAVVAVFELPPLLPPPQPAIAIADAASSATAGAIKAISEIRVSLACP
jgi:hypothetical protein